MPKPNSQQAVAWIEESIQLAYLCAAARPACEEYAAVVEAGAIRALEVIGELIKPILSLPIELGPLRPGVPLKGYVDMRIILAHKPWQVDLNIVWDTIERDLPVLQAALPELNAALQGLHPS